VDKSVIFAVAGSGKTTRIVEQLDVERRVLLLTYTENNHTDLRRRIIERFGYVPDNIVLRTYFAFLHSFCYRPYLSMKLKSKGITFRQPPPFSLRLPLEDRRRYLDLGRRVYHNRIAKLLDLEGCMLDLNRRIERYFDAIVIDEVQDLGGHDFNLLMAICRADVDVFLVGDFYQHTYDTSRDGAVNENLHADFGRYRKRFEVEGLRIDAESLINSHRCSATVCAFIREQLGIEINSQSKRATEVVVVDSQIAADRLHACSRTVKLFYQSHERYDCYSQNWGSSKGIDHFQDVCVVMNAKAWSDYQSGALRTARPVTKNKLYVACSRARGNLYLAPEKLFRSFRRPEAG
jgi:DNA helicase-2/ATP-dependent DNA helicase PcrA